MSMIIISIIIIIMTIMIIITIIIIIIIIIMTIIIFIADAVSYANDMGSVMLYKQLGLPEKLPAVDPFAGETLMIVVEK